MVQIKTTHKVVGGHPFDRVTDRCDRCGILWKQYNDSSVKPKCTGKPPEEKQALPIDNE
jgi:hypothetical protein